MTDSGNRLDSLFESARIETPRTSYGKTQSTFLKSIGIGGLGIVAMKWAQLSTKFKIVIMLSTTLILTSIVTVIGLSSEQVMENQETELINTLKNAEVMEVITDQEGNTETLYLNEAEEVAVRVRKETQANGELQLSLKPIAMKEIEGVTVLSNPIEPVPYQNFEDSTKNDEFTPVYYVIDRSVTEEKMKKIKEECAAAGIELRYDLSIVRGKARKCKIFMRLETDNCFITRSSKMRGSWITHVGWIQDENGKAIDFYSPPNE